MGDMQFLLFLLLIIALIFSTKSAANGDEMRLFYYSEQGLFYAKNNTNETQIQIRARQHVRVQALDYHPGTRTLYWTKPQRDLRDPSPQLFSMIWDPKAACDVGEDWKTNPYCRLTGLYLHPSLRVLREEDWNPRSLAVDYIGNKLYIVNTGERSVNVFDLKGKNKATVFESEPLIPFEVALDPLEGLMFILVANTQLGVSQIYRANMDGSSPQLIVNNTDILKRFRPRARMGFALDTSKQRIYFENLKERKIETVNYLGDERLTVTNVRKPRSISVFRDTLYYYAGSRTSGRCPSPFRSCKIDENGTCIKGSNMTMPCFRKGARVDALKPISSHKRLQTHNPCGIKNGGCQHHCLIKPFGTEVYSRNVFYPSYRLDFSCVCNNGYRLASNLKNCTRIKISHAYDQAFVSKEKNFTALWNAAESQKIFPISKSLLIRLTFNKANTLFYGLPFQFFRVSESGNELLETNLDPFEDEDDPETENIFSLKDSSNNTSIAQAIAYDWITKNLYYVKLYNNDEMGDLMVTKYTSDKRNAQYIEEREINVTLTKIYPPTFMVMHPYRGYLFATLRNGSVFRLTSDGSDKMLLPNIDNSVMLTVDFNKDKLYWLKSNGAVWFCNLDGTSPQELIKLNWHASKIENVYMYVYGDHLFIKSESHKKIWRYNKSDGVMSGSLDISEEIFNREIIGIKVSVKDAQYVDKEDHPCKTQNGGCGLFCFGVPEENGFELKRVCACSNNEDFVKYGEKCNNYTNKDVHLFFYSPESLFYTKGHTTKNQMNISSRKEINVTAIGYHAAKNTLFWVSPRKGYWTQSPKLYAMTWNFTLSDREDSVENLDIKILREEENWNPRSLAVDYVGDKLYIADTNERSIIVLNLDGHDKTNVFENDSLVPFDVAIDPSEGLMFVLVANLELGLSQIYRVNMDGTEQKLIVSDANTLKSFSVREKSAFTIDTNRKRIYFGNVKCRKIESVDYMGNKKLIVSKAKYPFGINVYKDTLYWSDVRLSVRVRVCDDQKYVLRTCRLDQRGVCRKGTSKTFGVESDFEYVTHAVMPINPYLQSQSQLPNPCEAFNGLCNHHCLLKPRTNQSIISYGCVCNRGYDLSYNGECSEREEDNGIYEFDHSYIPVEVRYLPRPLAKRTFPISRHLLIRLIYSSPDTIYYDKPFRFFQVSRPGDALFDIDLAPDDKKIPSFYEMEQCNSTYLKTQKEINTLILYQNKSIARVVTFDWVTNNVYYVKLTNDKKIGELMVLKYDQRIKKNLDDFKKDGPDRNITNSMSLCNISLPYFMVIHPHRGYLFASLYNGSVIRLNADGSSAIVLSDITEAEILAIDFDEDKLYWIDRDLLLWRANLDGSKSEILVAIWGVHTGKLYLYVDEEYVYVKSEGQHLIHRFNKWTKKSVGTIRIDLVNFYQENVGLKVFKKRERSHPCTLNNGGCKRFCFGVPQMNSETMHSEADPYHLFTKRENELNKICS